MSTTNFTGLTTKIKRSTALTAAALLLVFNASYLILSVTVYAENQLWAALRLDRMITSNSTNNGGTVMVRTGSTGTEIEASVQVTFPGNGTQGAASFGVNSTAANWTTTTTNLPAGCTAWPGIGTATAVSGATVTFPSTDLAATTTYCFNFAGTSTLSNPTSAGSGSTLTGTIVTRTSAPANIDTTNYAVAIVTNDQITVTATVPATFNMAIGTCGSNTDALGNLSVSSVVSSGTACRITFTTNAPSGWIAWAKDADSNLGLRSTINAYTIPGSSTLDDNCTGVDDDITAGTEGYGVDSNIITDAGGGGTVTIDGDFNCGAGFVGDYDTNFTEIATSNGAANGDVIDLIHQAAISGLTPPATDYQDVVTVSGAGQF